MAPAIRVKSLSRVKSVAPCSNAIAAIKASMVVKATPFARAARKMLAASLYVENPLGSSMSHCDRYCSRRLTSRLRPCRISVTTTPASANRLCVGDHTAQFGSGRSRGRAEKINPDGTIHQDQTRFLRMALKSPFQMPLPKYWRIPFRLSERTSNSKALSTICRFVLRRVSFFALRTKLSLMSILVLIE